MPDEVVIKTNHHPRPILEAYELTLADRLEVDYYDWSPDGAIQRGESSPEFFRYKGTLYDLAEFQPARNLSEPYSRWDGYQSDSFFSGILVRYSQDNEYVTVATYYV